MRSKLFVPGSRPELFAKALASEADAISIDLEDSVIESRKNEARANAADFLRSPDALSSGKIIVVRCNALGTDYFEADIKAIAQSRLGILNLPKVESVADVSTAVEALQKAEEKNGIAGSIGILATIESPAGMRRASRIARAHSRVFGLQLGLNDLFESLGVDRLDTANVHAAMFAVRMAAGEAGVMALDGAFTDIRNALGFRAEAEMARRLGFIGKSCIHPHQIASANDVFMPGDNEIAAALKVIEASQQAASNGLGAFTVDGRMIDLPSIRRAEEIVAKSQCQRNKPRGSS